jgi:hypothetical protein
MFEWFTGWLTSSILLSLIFSTCLTLFGFSVAYLVGKLNNKAVK